MIRTTAILAVGLGLGAAQAKETISGHILNAATGFGMVGFDLDVFDTAGKAVKVTGAKSGAGGAYTITLPGPGTYRVRADATLASAFADQFYNGQFLKSAATPITVNAGAAITGIDFHLSPGREIRGQVTAGGTPLANIDLDVFDAATGEFLSGYPGITAGDGTFAVGALPPGNYLVRVQPSAALGQFYVESWYNGGTNRVSATPITVGATMVTGINFNLVPGGSISGTVTDRVNGQILVGLDLDVFDLSGTRLPYNAVTDTNGQYYMGPMPTGQYYLRVDPKPTAGYERQYHADVNSLLTATPISVTTGVNVPNINFALGRAGHITGTIRDFASGAPLGGVDLDVFDSLGVRWDISAKTLPDGSYDLGPLPPGDYVVRADPALGMDHARVYYPNTFFRVQAVPVTVTANQATPGIDFNLAPAGAIAGTMTAAVGGAPVAGIDLDVFRASDTNRFDITATTAVDGSYTLGPLPAGDYFVRADPLPTSGWAVEFYPDVPGLAGAGWVHVAAGQTNSPIDFQLDGAGWITGTIVDTAAQPLNGIDLDIYDATTDLRVPITATTDATGAFLLGPLRPGSYKVRADPNPLLGYALEYFDAQTTRLAATPIIVTAGAARTGVNLTLERSAVLSGRIVSADTGQPIPNMDLDLLQASDQVRLDQTVLTDINGDFTLPEVPAGQYILRGDPDIVTQPYVRTYYGQTTDPLAATVFAVSAGQQRTGLNISLFSPVPPSVEIGSPADQSQIVVPATVDLVATASSSIAAIAQVDFYEGNQLLANVLAPPYSTPVNFTSTGARSFVAVATDTVGLVSTSAVVTLHGVNNTAPSVALTAPADETSYLAPADITISATATDSDGSVAKVEFFNGAAKLGADTTAPYSFAWAGVTAGDYSLTAVATDDRGLTQTSAPVTVHVRNNQAPTVALTAPADGASFTAPADITLTATANDPDGSVAKVEFYAGTTTKLGEDATAPYSFVWANVPVGDYTLTAVAVDDLGLRTTSAGITVHVTTAGPGDPVTLLLSLNGAGVEIRFDTTPGRTYFLETTASLEAPAWTVTGQVAGDGQPALLTDTPPASGARFYRVRVE